MLSIFRRFTRSRIGAFIALGFLAIIAFAFVAGDISGTGNWGGLGGGGDTVAKVGGSSLSTTELQSRAQRSFEQARRATPGTQMATFLAQGGVEQILDQLVAGLTVTEFGDDQGMGVSKRMVDAQIAAIPAFQDASGAFSQDQFRRLLSMEGISEKSLREDIARELTGKQVVGVATLGVRLPDSLVLPYASLLLEQRAGRIAAIPAEAFLPKTDPTEAELQAYYKANADRFVVPEQRRLRYAVIDISRFAAASQPSQTEIAAYFAQNKATYSASETRNVEQLILPTEAAAKTVAADVRGGKSMALAAQASGLSVASLASQTPEMLGRLSSSAVASAAFAAPKDGLIGPFRIALGWTIVKVTGINRQPARTLEQVSPQIVETLKGQKAQKLLADFTGKIEDQVGNGATFDEAVKDNGLATETTPFLISTGQSVQVVDYKPSADITPLLAPAFGMEADDDAQLVPLAQDKRYALLDVGDILPPAPPPLAKVRPVIVQQYKLSQGAAKAKVAADQVRAKVAAGMKLDAAMASVGVPLPPVQPAGGRRADVLRGDRKPPPPLALLFTMAQGSVKLLPIEGGQGYFVVQLDRINRGDAGNQPVLINRVRDQLANVVGAEYGDQFERALEKELKVTRNQTAIAGVKQELRRANGGGTQ